jgi:hypothetical protein
MSRFSRDMDTRKLEGDLARQRPVPSDDFVTAVVQTIGPGRPRQGRPRQGRTAQLGVALALTGTLMLGFGVGGAGYALSSGSAKK